MHSLEQAVHPGDVVTNGVGGSKALMADRDLHWIRTKFKLTSRFSTDHRVILIAEEELV